MSKYPKADRTLLISIPLNQNATGINFDAYKTAIREVTRAVYWTAIAGEPHVSIEPIERDE